MPRSDRDAAERPSSQRTPTERTRAAYTGDILALSRATIDAVGRAMRTSPEVRDARVMARWPLDLEALMLELEPMAPETSLAAVAGRWAPRGPSFARPAIGPSG